MDAEIYWRCQINALPGFDAKGESFWILALVPGRRFSGCHAIVSHVSRSPVLFADEIAKAECLKGVKEFILVHHRPDAIPDASDQDKERAREIILAARARGCRLLDYIVCNPGIENGGRFFPLGSLRSFRSNNPFPLKPIKKIRNEN